MQWKMGRTIALAYNRLPRTHRVLLGSLSALTLAVAAWRPLHLQTETYPIVRSVDLASPETGDVSLDSSTSTKLPAASTTLLSNTLEPEASEPIDTEQPAPTTAMSQDELNDNKESGDDSASHEYVVSSGDTLSTILTQYGIELSDVAMVSAANIGLRHLRVGQRLSWTMNEDGELQTLTWEISRRETRFYERHGNIFKENKQIQNGEWHNLVINGRVDGSFVNDAKQSGMSNAEINAVIKSMQWQLDFRRLRKDDQFAILMSREHIDGHRELSELLGVRIRSGGKDYYAIRAEDGKFYDRTGSGVVRGFMRFPTMKQFRVTSGFNPRRLNPVTGRIAPHKGIDFSMPVGTPILAVADGEVVVSQRDGTAGNYIAIRHGRQYTTRYMHLKKSLVKPGQKVKRGDRIAISGNTGRSTGPHLHYEFWINQQAVNPMTVKLPHSEGLSGKDRTNYLAVVKEVAPQLQLD